MAFIKLTKGCQFVCCDVNLIYLLNKRTLQSIIFNQVGTLVFSLKDAK